MASDSSTSTTPVLTPESTGVQSAPSPEPSATKKARRQTAFYPNVNSSNKPQKPFSRSAAKRESVMALGSIEHLQHYFTKTGIAPKRTHQDKHRHGLVPALGGMNHIRTNPSLGNNVEFQLPPSPAIPEPRQALPPVIKTYETDPQSLLPGVVEDLAAVADAWHISGQHQDTSSASTTHFDVLGVLKTTTHTIRSIRNYVLSLPDESTGTIRAQFRPQLLGPGKPSTSSGPSVQTRPDPLTLIRRSALEVLTVLRQLEESCRLPLSDEAYDAQSDGAAAATSPPDHLQELPQDDDSEFDTSLSFSLVQVHGRYESVPVWEDEEDVFATDGDEEKEKREYWDDRLVLGSGWLYRQDIRLEDLSKERGVVGAYLDVVDEALFGGKGGIERGWERERRRAVEKGVARAKGRRVSAGDGEGKLGAMFLANSAGRRRVSTGMVNILQESTLSEEPDRMGGISEGEESVDDEDLPDWAKRALFPDQLDRAHAILSAFLPPIMLGALAPASPRTAFLASLSSGQLLCVTYNACVRRSNKPWGYISRDAIHDILALEETERDVGWTFRRTDNLRLWAGALKLRYLLPIQVVNAALPSKSGAAVPSSPSSQRFASATEPVIVFDARAWHARMKGGKICLRRSWCVGFTASSVRLGGNGSYPRAIVCCFHCCLYHYFTARIIYICGSVCITCG
ncbi:hypothetical protein BD779DRAFT_1804426 [Infundibulicybe gibba]|nr:hypothetical protein BD779DRAFT_1804426 [Infundibulicybe gibba]